MRQERKLDHVRLAAAEVAGDPGFEDIYLVPASLPEVDWAELDLSTTLGRRRLAAPLIINAMTGGAVSVGKINAQLARLAKAHGLAMAVGSQKAALEHPELAETYSVVRREHPDGVLLANLSAMATVDDGKRAVEMIEADFLQIHLNAAQELVMPEGDRHFRGWLAHIEQLVEQVGVPVLVKEVGFGLSREAVKQLYDVGVRLIDVGGRGGTNFARIEAKRGEGDLDPGLLHWGLPTAWSLLDVLSLGFADLEVVASGGLRYGSQAAKALALGACAVGVAGPILQPLLKGGYEAADAFLTGFIRDLKRCLLLTGSRTLADLRSTKPVVMGEARAWLEARVHG